MHVHSMGSAADLARRVKPAIDLIDQAAKQASQSAGPAGSTPAGTLNSAALAKIVGHEGEQSDLVYKITIGRPDIDLREHGADQFAHGAEYVGRFRRTRCRRNGRGPRRDARTRGPPGPQDSSREWLQYRCDSSPHDARAAYATEFLAHKSGRPWDVALRPQLAISLRIRPRSSRSAVVSPGAAVRSIGARA